MSRVVAAALSCCLLLLAGAAGAQGTASAAKTTPAVASTVEETSVAATPSAAASPSTAASPSAADLQRARTLFQRGVQSAQRGEFSVAVKRFSEALELHDAPAVEYNLASALYETGKYADAYNRTQNVLAHPETPQKVRERAERLERALHPYVSRLTVLTGGENGDMLVQIDGEALDPSLLGRPRAVAAGQHEVVATRGGATISRRQVNIPLRTAAIVDVSLVVTAQEAAQVLEGSGDAESGPVVVPGVIDDRGDDSERKRKLRRWAGIAAGVVAVAAGVTVGIMLAGGDEGAGPAAPVAGDTGVVRW